MAIQFFRDKEAEVLFQTGKSRRLPAVLNLAIQKPDMLDAAKRMTGLRIPRGNYLKALKGGRVGRHGIWIQQWRS